MAARRKKPAAPAEPATTPDVVPHPVASADVRSATSEVRTQPPAEAEGEQRRQWQPDPFSLMTISLGPNRDSPTMTLFRFNRMNQLAIRFGEKPEEEHRLRLREGGWRWRESEGVWTMQMDRERRATSQVEAERVFTEIGEAMRAERGLSGRSGVGS